MSNLETILSGPKPAIIACIVEDINQARAADIADFADIYEFRADRVRANRKPNYRELLHKLRKLPILGTVRLASEGGAYNGSMERRIDLFEGLMEYVAGVDVELAAEDASNVISLATNNSKTVIVSSHRTYTPEERELQQLYDSSVDLGADYVKIATKINSPDDYRRLASFTSSVSSNNVIAIGVGPYQPENPSEDLLSHGSRAIYASDHAHPVTPSQRDYRTVFQSREQLFA